MRLSSRRSDSAIAKSKPVMLAAALIWGILAWWMSAHGEGSTDVRAAFESMFLEYSQVFFFLVVGDDLCDGDGRSAAYLRRSAHN